MCMLCMYIYIHTIIKQKHYSAVHAYTLSLQNIQKQYACTQTCIIKESHKRTLCEIPWRYNLLLEMTKYLRIKRVNMSFCHDLIHDDIPLHPQTGKVTPTDHSLAGLRLIPSSSFYSVSSLYHLPSQPNINYVIISSPWGKF